MKFHEGFTLIELLVYSALSIFLVVFIMQFLSIFERSVILRSTDAVYTASAYAGMDALCRVCSAAPAERKAWLSEKEDTIMWRHQQGIDGFAFKHNSLMRVSRSLDSAGHLRAPVSSMLMNNVRGSFCVHRSEDLVSAITVNMTVHCPCGALLLIRRINLLERIIV